MRIKKYFLYVTVAVFALASCKKSSPAVPYTGNNVYVAGYAYGKTGSSPVAIYWKNGVAHALTSTSVMSVATDMVLNDTDVYIVGGSNINYLNAATYWKNSVPFTFGYNDGAQSIAVAASNVYITFTMASPDGWDEPYNWQNGVLSAITNGTSEADAEKMILNGNDVYVTGYITPYGGPSACYWKNRVVTSLENNNLQASVARGICMQDTDLYISGDIQTQTGYEAVYWKNGTRVVLGTDPQDVVAFAVAVNGTDVYVAGTLNQKATYWKNGVQTTLGGGVVYSIAIIGSDIYFAGIDGGAQACYWKNGVEVKLEPGPAFVSGTSGAVKIVVTPH